MSIHTFIPIIMNETIVTIPNPIHITVTINIAIAAIYYEKNYLTKTKNLSKNNNPIKFVNVSKLDAPF